MKSAFGLSIPETIEELVQEDVALLIWDMQHAIADRVSNREEVIANIQILLKAAHTRGIPVIFSQHYSVPFEAEDVSWIRTWWKRSGLDSPSELQPLAIPGSFAWEILAEVAPVAGDVVLPKTRPSLFVGTPARDILSGRGIKTLLITGVTTERGVLTTTNHAQLLGLIPVIVSDAVGSYTELAHEKGLTALSEVADLTTTTEVASIWAK